MLQGFTATCFAGTDEPADGPAWTTCRDAPTRRCALDHAVEIVRTLSTSSIRAATVAQIARAQVDAGLMQQASGTIDLLKSDEMAAVVGHAARVKAETGRLDEALRLANAIADPGARGLVLGSIAVAEGEAGKIDDALRRVRAESDGTARAVAIRRAAWGLRMVAVERGDDGKLVEALREAEPTRMPMSVAYWHPSMHVPALWIIADAQVRAGKITEAVQSAGLARFDREQVFAALLHFLARAGKVSEALGIVQAIETNALRVVALQIATDPTLLSSSPDINFDPDRDSELDTVAPQNKVAPGALAIAQSFSEPARSPALRMLAEAQANANEPAAALEAAKLIDNPEDRVGALLAIGKAQARIGQQAPAKASFNEALQTMRSAPLRGSLVQSIAVAEAEAGRTDEARALAETINEQWSRGTVFAEIARALARAGKAAEAQKAADAVKATSLPTDPNQAIVRGFAEGGHIDQAVATAKGMGQQAGEIALHLAAVTLCDNGQTGYALQLARAIRPGELQVDTLLKIARALRRSGAEADASNAIREAFNVVAADSNLFMPMELVSLSRALPD
ncbi:MAG: hypothetical protein JOY90_01595 [Bradyrhizobium sp.]|uniref:tetratricopeptide repeat protein n=1 Tax=Bradyrhizobium sp. TaxID=376 RepID=UPI001D246D3E|nr:hypothetical protein [Bradyrhizobium sp.]MBV9559147.1 hypothetical protein [Bradyrhizobium sp.]